MALIKDSFCQYKQHQHQQQRQRQHKHHIEMNGPNDLHFIRTLLLTRENLFPQFDEFVYFRTHCVKTCGRRCRFRTTQCAHIPNSHARKSISGAAGIIII